jgi:hypothetical protein
VANTTTTVSTISQRRRADRDQSIDVPAPGVDIDLV